VKTFCLSLATIFLTGCMCRPGVVDCTTGRPYAGYCKPLCGGPLDPFVWAAGDCSTCCCCVYECGYIPYGGRTFCGDDMVYSPSCVAPPLRWAPPAIPTPPTGHIVHSVPHASAASPAKQAPTVPPAPPAPVPPAKPTQDRLSLPQSMKGTETEDRGAPSMLRDTRNEEPTRSRL